METDSDQGLNFGITGHVPSTTHLPLTSSLPTRTTSPARGTGLGKASVPCRFSIGQEGKGFRTQPETSNDELGEEMERAGA